MIYSYLSMILDGLRVTLSVVLVSTAVACIFGLAGVYTAVIRALPDLLLIEFDGGQILPNRIASAQGWGYLDINAFMAGTITLGLVLGAYLSETFRSAVLAIRQGQIKAGHAMGLSRTQFMHDIVIPRMIRHAISCFRNNLLVMLKVRALVPIIELDDVVNRVSLASAATRA
ncbi:MAG: ABC transporter permease subunit [Paracoccus sp. (in: a-proteobacteria)]|uniref:ABC transporter permease subunit n=1 Tax=Paracoccus sp. TaxID=267 RepID=UPI0032427911